MNAEILLTLAKQNHRHLVEIRRHLHRYPELSQHEFETGKYLAGIMESLGLEVRHGIAGTGVVALLRGANPGRTVALRADMDALPVQEQTTAVYKSTVPGVMHACGHDAHMSLTVGTAMILASLKEQIHGNIKFIFQPAEEAPGGAKPMIDAGVLENPTVDAILGGHVWGSVESGRIEVRPGPIMASSDILRLTIHGKGGHAAQPHTTIDPIVIGCEIVGALQKIVSRQTDPAEAAVISICVFQAGEMFNVIPCSAYLEGSIRTLNNELRLSMPQKIEAVVRGITQANGATYDLDYYMGYPVTVNHKGVTETVRQAAVKVLGQDHVGEAVKASMGGEDFAYYLLQIPGTFIRIGIRNEAGGICQEIHHPAFDIDEDILATAVYAQALLDMLES
jgi:amidohydrolase